MNPQTITKVSQEEGIHIIDNARYYRDDTNSLNLYVKDQFGTTVHCFLNLRPHYCDRGHIQLLICGDLGIDEADSFPRYFFTFEEADNHLRRFLKWRLFGVRTAKHVLPLDKFEFIKDPVGYTL